MKQKNEEINEINDLFNEYHTIYGKQSLFAPLQSIYQQIHYIRFMYLNFPETSINLLEQLKVPLEEQEYLKKVTNPIRFMSLTKNNPDLGKLAHSLDVLRMLINQNEAKLKVFYREEIANLPVDGDKSSKFACILNEVCLKAIEIAISRIKEENLDKNDQHAAAAAMP